MAKAYILYREKRAQIRRAKQFFGVRDELKLSVNAIRILERRYLLKDENGNVVETPLNILEFEIGQKIIAKHSIKAT